MFNPRAWLMATCHACRRRFSTGIRMETATRYGARGWNAKCPYCAARQPTDPETGATTPASAPKALSL